MSKHTAGPWAAHFDRRHEKWLVTAEDGEVEIAQDRGWGDEYEAEDFANARLIAAAPEMLSMLIELEDALEDGHWQHTKTAIRKLIAKATGETE